VGWRAWEASTQSLEASASPPGEENGPTKQEHQLRRTKRKRAELALRADINADCDQPSRQGRTHGNSHLAKSSANTGKHTRVVHVLPPSVPCTSSLFRRYVPVLRWGDR
jgi:hypothetical protein